MGKVPALLHLSTQVLALSKAVLSAVFMQLYAIICNYLQLYAILCNSMQLYAIICSYSSYSFSIHIRFTYFDKHTPHMTPPNTPHLLTKPPTLFPIPHPP